MSNDELKKRRGRQPRIQVPDVTTAFEDSVEIPLEKMDPTEKGKALGYLIALGKDPKIVRITWSKRSGEYNFKLANGDIVSIKLTVLLERPVK